MGDTILDLRSVWRTFRNGEVEVHAVRNVSLSIGRGEFVAVMGTSGSGKSTLMNILGCLDRPSGGEYWLGGRNIAGLSPGELAVVRNQTLGFVFQSFNLLRAHLGARECRAAADLQRPHSACRRTHRACAGGAGAGGPGASADASAVGALGWPATTHRHCPRPRHPSHRAGG